MASEHVFSDYHRFLSELGSAGTPYFLEGGQAVNFWAEYLSNKNSQMGLEQFRPFTSKDCDIWVSLAALRHIESRFERGALIKGNSPADGQLGILTLDGPVPLTVDLMTSVYGTSPEKLPRVLERSIQVNGIRVMDPISLFQSKCHCFLGLNQTGRQDEKHVRMLGALLPEHFAEALADTAAGDASERSLIQEMKFFLTILRTQTVRRTIAALELDVERLISRRRLLNCDLPKVERFAANSMTLD